MNIIIKKTWQCLQYTKAGQQLTKRRTTTFQESKEFWNHRSQLKVNENKAGFMKHRIVPDDEYANDTSLSDVFSAD